MYVDVSYPSKNEIVWCALAVLGWMYSSQQPHKKAASRNSLHTTFIVNEFPPPSSSFLIRDQKERADGGVAWDPWYTMLLCSQRTITHPLLPATSPVVLAAAIISSQLLLQHRREW